MISVCMATYNGKDYIGQQIISILKNLSSNDELIISDDGSTDGTIEIINDFLLKDTRVKLLKGPKNGFIKNFENSLKHAKGEYIFLSDQDDVWKDDKVKEVMDCFKKTNATLIVHDCQIIDEDGNVVEPSFFAIRNSAPGVIHNLIKNSYIGCCMALKRELLDVALPFPPSVPWHDQWLGLINDLIGKTVFLPKVLFSYRRHRGNVSSMQHSSIRNMIRIRWIFIVELIKRSNKLRDNGL